MHATLPQPTILATHLGKAPLRVVLEGEGVEVEVVRVGEVHVVVGVRVEGFHRNKLLRLSDHVLPSYRCTATREGPHHDKTGVQHPWGGGGEGMKQCSSEQ